MALGAEERLLRRLTRAFVDRRSRRATSVAAGATVDWTRFLQLAETHLVGPVIHQLVVDGACDGVPAHARDALHLAALRAAVGNTLLQQELFRLLPRFADAGIPVLVYKGLPLAATCYGDTSLRGHQDIDLMLRSPDMERASRVMEAEGYAPEAMLARATARQTRHWCELNFDKVIAGKAKLHVELHWRVLPAFTAIAGEGDEIVPRGTRIDVDGVAVTTLDPVDHLLALALHGAKHQWRELRLILDVALLASQLSSRAVDALHRRARAWRVRRLLALALGLAERLGAPRISERPMTREARGVERDYVWGRSTRTPSSLFLFRRLDGWSDAARFLVGFARSELDRRTSPSP